MGYSYSVVLRNESFNIVRRRPGNCVIPRPAQRHPVSQNHYA